MLARTYRAFDGISPRSRFWQRVVRRRCHSSFSAVARGDIKVRLTGYAPDAVHEWSPELVSLGFPERAEGHDALFRAMSEWDQAWEHWRMPQHFIVDLKERLVLLNRIAGRAAGAGVDVEIDHAALIDLRHGLIVRERDFNEWPRGLEAAGLDPRSMGQLEAMRPGEVAELRPVNA